MIVCLPIASPIRSSMTVNSSEYPLDVCSLVASRYFAASSVLNKSNDAHEDYNDYDDEMIPSE